jgi:hypothetical protein
MLEILRTYNKNVNPRHCKRALWVLVQKQQCRGGEVNTKLSSMLTLGKILTNPFLNVDYELRNQLEDGNTKYYAR